MARMGTTSLSVIAADIPLRLQNTHNHHAKNARGLPNIYSFPSCPDLIANSPSYSKIPPRIERLVGSPPPVR